ncbi:MAG: NUDIX domain-containing protein [Clostridia bacterium]|nr:NUDIX domain-containing protein [Clostridia bacterium]
MKQRYESKIAVFLVLTREKNEKKEVLLQKRCNTGYMDGKYDMACSGHLEAGESLTMAMARECEEEIGIKVKPKDLELVSIIHAYNEDYMHVFFTTQKYEGTPKIMEKEKCDDLNWFDIDNLPCNTIERIKNVLKNIQNGIVYDDDNFSCQKLKGIIESK